MSLVLPRQRSLSFPIGTGAAVLAHVGLAALWLGSAATAPLTDPRLKGREVIELDTVEMVMMAAPPAPIRAADVSQALPEQRATPAKPAAEPPPPLPEPHTADTADLARPEDPDSPPEPNRPEAQDMAAAQAASPASSAGDADRTASAETERGLSDAEATAQIADWQKSVVLALAAAKTYPDAARAARAEGKVILSFTLDRSGRVIARSVLQGSGHAALDAAALALIDGLPAFDPPPAVMGAGPFPLQVPIAYSFR